jgi:hypothetical protein
MKRKNTWVDPNDDETIPPFFQEIRVLIKSSENKKYMMNVIIHQKSPDDDINDDAKEYDVFAFGNKPFSDFRFYLTTPKNLMDETIFSNSIIGWKHLDEKARGYP